MKNNLIKGKTNIVIIAALISALCLSACSGSSVSSNETGGTDSSNTENTSAEETDSGMLSIGDTISTDEWEFKLYTPEFTDKISSSSEYNNAKSDEYFEAVHESATADSSYLEAPSCEEYFTYSFTLEYLGDETMTASPCSFCLIYDDTYTFTDGKLALIGADGFWTQDPYTFEPLQGSISGRGYIYVSDQDEDDPDSSLQLTVTLDGEDYTYSFSVKDVYVFDIASLYKDSDLVDMAEAFGDEDGNINWTEGSFPYFIDLRETWPLLSEEEITESVIGDWEIKEYTSDPSYEKVYTFDEGGVGSYTGNPSLGDQTVYWIASDGILYFQLREITAAKEDFTYFEVRAASDDVWVLYDEDHDPAYVMIRQ